MVTLSSSSCSSGFHVTFAQEHVAELTVFIASLDCNYLQCKYVVPLCCTKGHSICSLFLFGTSVL